MNQQEPKKPAPQGITLSVDETTLQKMHRRKRVVIAVLLVLFGLSLLPILFIGILLLTTLL